MISEGVWILAEVRSGEIKGVTHELLTRGRRLADKLNQQLWALVIGCDIDEVQAEELILRGADRVLLFDDPRLKHFNPESYSRLLQELVEEERPEILLAAATSTGCALMPHLQSGWRQG